MTRSVSCFHLLLGQFEKLPEAVAKNYFIQILNGLQHCNELNIVHRDLKPENILVTTSNVVKISGIEYSRYYGDRFWIFCTCFF